MRIKSPVTGVQFAAWGGMFSIIDCCLVAMRQKVLILERFFKACSFLQIIFYILQKNTLNHPIRCFLIIFSGGSIELDRCRRSHWWPTLPAHGPRNGRGLRRVRCGCPCDDRRNGNSDEPSDGGPIRQISNRTAAARTHVCLIHHHFCIALFV